jgi:hypothetical protein
MDVLQMMECMLAIQEEIDCNQAKEEAHLERMEALLGLRSWGEVIEACPEKSKAAVVTFEEGSDEIEATDLDANLEEMEAAMERQELHNDTMNVDNIGSLEDRFDDRNLVVRHRQEP